MSRLTDTISPLVAVLWVFYPDDALVIDRILCAFNDNDDDDDGGKGIRVTQPQLQSVPSGA